MAISICGEHLLVNITIGAIVCGSTSYYSVILRTIILQVTTGQRFKPSQIQNLRISKHTEKSIEISWRSPHDSGGEMLAVYRIYRNGVPIASVSVSCTNS